MHYATELLRGICPKDAADQLNPLPEWGKCWRDFEKDGDWHDALYQ